MNMALGVLAMALAGTAYAADPPKHAVDHVGIGAPDLEKGSAFVEQRTGVKAQFGGVHPGRGTQNALLSLGNGTYVEVIAPVPGQKLSDDTAGLAKLTAPKPMFFAVRSKDLDATVRALKSNGFATSEIRPGSRQKPDGTVLKWRTVGLADETLDSAPFFIEWDAASAHPSTTSPSGCTLTKLEAEDPHPEKLTKLFAVLGLDVPVAKAEHPGLRLTVACAKGTVVFGP
jgi:hypothetical protein